MSYVLVFIGGGLGSLARFAFSKYFGVSHGGFPLATLLSNTVSCVILGLVVSALYTKATASNYTAYSLLFIATGFCGGFSTFSTFSLDTFQLFNNGQYAVALGNVAANILVCLLAIALGFYLGKLL